mmetsp:Transcript_37153/g.93269  ORF Transcript_37153/g.93269 Transcript_37153/m.93269 type:complete len:86 (-) Transcript_37153:339-596(-)
MPTTHFTHTKTHTNTRASRRCGHCLAAARSPDWDRTHNHHQYHRPFYCSNLCFTHTAHSTQTAHTRARARMHTHAPTMRPVLVHL